MQCFVYQMRHNGQRLQRQALEQLRPAQGWLVYGPSVRHQSKGKTWEVHLRDKPVQTSGRPAFDRIAPLYSARLLHIDGALHIAGFEDHGRPQTKASPWYRPQSWLVTFDQETAQAFIARRLQSIEPTVDDEDVEASDALYDRLMRGE